MTLQKEAARNSCNYSTPNVKSSADDEHIVTDFERGTRYAAYIICGMFAFMIAWMVVVW